MIYKQYNIDENYNGIYTLKDNNILILTNNILEIDRQTGKITNEYKLNNNYTSIDYKDNIIYASNNDHTITINTKTKEKEEISNNNKINNTIIPIYTNNNYKKEECLLFNITEYTKEEKNNILLLNYIKPDNIFKQYNININKEENALMITGEFNKDDYVYIILDKFLDKRIYKLDTSNKISYKYIHNNSLKGKYSIYIKINDKIYKINNYINF